MVRTGANAMTTGWVKSAQVAASAGTAVPHRPSRATDGASGPAPTPRCRPTPRRIRAAASPASRPASRRPRSGAPPSPTPATQKGGAERRPSSRPALADGRTSDERMRDVFAQRYDPEAEAPRRRRRLRRRRPAVVPRPAASSASRRSRSKARRRARRPSTRSSRRRARRRARPASRCGRAPPRSSGTRPGRRRPNDTSSALPSCERLWEDVRGRADRLKVDLELLERDAREHDIYPGVVREMLAARGLAEPTSRPPTPPVTDVR